MNMLEAVSSVFSKYATFKGRARRAEYWWFTLFTTIAGLVLSIIQYMMNQFDGFGITDLFSLAILLPSIAVCARRLHDIGKSGWWQLLLLVPIIGAIVLLVWMCRRGDIGSNAFGEDPIPNFAQKTA